MLGKITERQCEQQDLLTWDGALASCCGQKGPKTLFALKLMAQTEGIMLDPVYTAKTLARVFGLLEEGYDQKGSKGFNVAYGWPTCSVWLSRGSRELVWIKQKLVIKK